MNQNISVGGRNKWLGDCVGWSTKGSVNKWIGGHQVIWGRRSKQETGSIAATCATLNMTLCARWSVICVFVCNCLQNLPLHSLQCDSGLETNTFVNRLRDTRPDWAVNKRGRRDDRVSSQGRLRWLRRAFFGFGEGPMYPPYRPIWGNPHPRQAWA